MGMRIYDGYMIIGSSTCQARRGADIDRDRIGIEMEGG